MFLAIDIGATKTLLAVFSTEGKIVFQHKFATSKTYTGFIKDLAKAFNNELRNFKITACCCALPGSIDRKTGTGLEFGNLNWHNVPVKKDLEKLLKDVPVWVEHDSSLAGLSEALLTHAEYKKVLYLTISTGIGDGIIIDGKIDTNLADSEAGQMVLEHDGKLQKWEEFASGKALVAKYGKLAKDIDEPKVWEEFANNLAPGIDQLAAAFQPDVIIIGGGVGSHYQKFGSILVKILDDYQTNLVKIPKIIQAKRPEEAVVYGCYDYYQQQI